MRIDLAVPYGDKEEAKAAGAKWDPARKIWYLTDPETGVLQWCLGRWGTERHNLKPPPKSEAELKEAALNKKKKRKERNKLKKLGMLRPPF